MSKNEKFWEIEGHPQNLPIHTTSEEKDIFYMKIAKLVANRSKCASRQIGAVLVNEEYDDIISLGCNGAPPGIDLCQDRNAQCPRQEVGYKSGKGLHICPAQHAERNCIYHAARKGVPTENTTLYCYCGLPCMECWKAIICAGIKRVVYVRKEDEGELERDDQGNLIQFDIDGHLIRYDDLSVVLAEQSNVKLASYTEEEININKGKG